MELNKGDILGHEFCGVVAAVGPAVKKVQVGKRYVASFQIACGDVSPAYPFQLSASRHLTACDPVLLLQPEAILAV